MNQYNNTGDNVAGNKIENNYSGINEDNLKQVIEDTFKSILLLEVESTQISLKNLERLHSKDMNVECNIQYLKVFLTDYTKNPADPKNINLLKSNYQQSELATAILINHFAHTNKKKEALQLYEQSNKTNFFIKSVYNRQLLDVAQLNNILENEFSLLTDFEKQNLAFPCSIISNQSNCELLLSELNNISDSKTNTFFKFWLKRAILFFNLGETHYYLSHYANKKQLDEFIVECEQVVDTKDYDWRFILNIIFPLSTYIEFSNQRFIRLCSEQADDIKANFKNEWQLLAFYDDFVNVDEGDEWTYYIRKSENDEAYKEEILSKIINKNVWNISEANFFLNFGDINDIEPNNLTIESPNDVIKLILEVQLDFAYKLKNEITINESDYADSFNNLKNFQEVAPKSILLFCNNFLMRHQCYHLIILFLKQYVGERNELWFSPIIKIYAESLIYLRQYEEFQKICKKVHPESYDELYHYTNAIFYHEFDNENLAVEHIQKSLSLEPNNFTAWALFCNFYNIGYKVDITVLESISMDIFKYFEHPDNVTILVALAKLKNFDFLNELITQKFLENPTKYCKTISNFFFQQIIGSISFEISQTNYGVLNSVEYEIQGEVRRHLITERKFTDNTFCIHKNSELGHILKEAKKGDNLDSSKGKINVLETYSPIILINQICSYIRNENNDGSDVYNFFNTENVDDFVENLLYFTQQQNKSHNELLSDDSIPYFMKLGYLSGGELVPRVLELLHNKQTAKQLSIFNEGEKNTTFVADMNTCLYFVITGLVDIIFKKYKVIVSKSTQQILLTWLDDLELGKIHGRLQAFDDKLIFSDKDSLLKDSENLRVRIRKFTQKTSVLKISPLNIPYELVKITDERIIDSSLSSSIEVALSHDLPLLTIDPLLAQFLHFYDVQIQNPLFVFDDLCNKTSFTDRAQGIELFSMNNLPYIFKYEDVLNYLSENESVHKYLVLRNLIVKLIFENEELRENILTRLVTMVIYDSIGFCGQYRTLNKFDEYRFTLFTCEQLLNKLFYEVTNIQNGLTAEQKIAKLIYDVFLFNVKTIKQPIFVNIIQKRFINYVSLFCYGHFLSVAHIRTLCKTHTRGKTQLIKNHKNITIKH